MRGRILNISRGINGKPQVLLELEDIGALKILGELLDTVLDIVFKKWRNKKSLSANAYAWVLIDKLAEKLNISKEQIYRESIKQIGGVSETVCVQDKALESLITAWTCNGIGWQVDTIPSKIDGCTNAILYYGSSVYDTKQMSALISRLIDDCRDNAIETKDDAEIQSLLESWKA